MISQNLGWKGLPRIATLGPIYANIDSYMADHSATFSICLHLGLWQIEVYIYLHFLEVLKSVFIYFHQITYILDLYDK